MSTEPPTSAPSLRAAETDSQKRSLPKLVENYDGGIRIPMIQRDYAQGRPSWENSRNRFLSDIRESLMPEGKPLHLDFVYGIRQTEDKSEAFCPLDGQQRLTTLFLLHWYLAARDECFSDFQSAFRNSSTESKFTYQVRPGGRSFFDALGENAPSAYEWKTNAPKDWSLTNWFRQQSWFRSIWERDPSVAGALVMLDAIHDYFKDHPEASFRILMNGDRITFQVLDLQAVGLHDDLYLRMNARGRPLTTFETFKARFDKFLEGENQFPGADQLGSCTVKTAKAFADRIDKEWIDFIWTHYGPTNVDPDDTSSIDRAFINLFRAVALASLEPTKVNEVKAITKKDAEKMDTAYAQSLSGGEPGYDDFENGGWLNTKFTTHLIHVLEACESHKNEDPATDSEFILFQEPWFNKDHERRAESKLRLLDRILRKNGELTPTLTDYFQFAACVRFLTAYGPQLNSEYRAEFHDWNRVVRNLVINSTVGANNFLNILSGLDQLMEGSKGQGILKFLADTDEEIAGFSKDQIKEERLKAKLIRKDKNGWCKPIQDAEEHPYFRSQIDFLLKFSEADPTCEDQSLAQIRFEFYWQRATRMFGDDGLLQDLKTNDYLWQRALLATGNYLLHYSGGRWSLLDPDRSGSVTWKSFLAKDHGDKRSYLKQLWDAIDINSVVDSLNAQLQKAKEGSWSKKDYWRKILCNTLDTWKYCGDRLIHFHDRGSELAPRVSLQQITNRTHKTYEEIHTYCLRKEIGLSKERLDEDKTQYTPLRYAGWGEWPGSYHPHLKFELEYNGKTLVFQLYCHCHEDDGFSLRIPLKEIGDDKEVISASLITLGFESELKSVDPVQNPYPWWLGEHLVLRQDPANPLDGASFLKTVADKLSQLP